jgi:tyrosyl-tRNA synthetase
MVLQAYDFVELARRTGCVLQMGGSDQWGNIINGVELGRRAEQMSLYGLTTPLITTAAGAKMGKTAAGAVWLNKERRSPYDYWQFWRNTEDGDIGRFLRLFTELPEDEIRRAEALEGVEINDAKKLLADAATKLCHGAEAAEAAARTARETFEEGRLGAELPSLGVSRDELAGGIPAYELLRRVGLCASNGEARRLIKGGGARINDVPIDQETRVVTLDDLAGDDPAGDDPAGHPAIKLSAGKKRHALVIIG